MVGNLKPSFCGSETSLKSNFMLYYCSLCSQIRNKYGITASASLNYDITFILVALSKYIKTDSTETQTKCPAKYFLGKMPVLQQDSFSKAADLSIALSSLKIDDYITDETGFINANILMSFANKKYSKHYEKIVPTLSQDAQDVFKNYHAISKNSETDIEIVREQSGKLAYQICYEIGKQTTIPETELIKLSQLFKLLGESISILDPLVDIEKDITKNNFNIIEYHSTLNKSELKNEFKEFSLKYLALHQEVMELLHKDYENTNPDFFTILKKSISQNLNAINEASQNLFNEVVFKLMDVSFAQAYKCSHKKEATLATIGAIPLMSCMPLDICSDYCNTAANCSNACNNCSMFNNCDNCGNCGDCNNCGNCDSACNGCNNC